MLQVPPAQGTLLKLLQLPPEPQPSIPSPERRGWMVSPSWSMIRMPTTSVFGGTYSVR
jgi:hypothetical protein